MKFEHGLDLPRRLQIEFSSVIQRLTEQSGTEITADQIWSSFESTYLTPTRPVALVGHSLITTARDTGATTLEANVRLEGGERWIKGHGNGPIAAFVDALGRDAGLPVEIVDYAEHALGEGADARAVAYVETRTPGSGKVRWGVGVDANIVTASLRAVVSAVNRH
jgi:2-isopropylmalate synthase